MDLFLLRHGIAVDREDPRFPCDADRPLTEKGKKKVRGVTDFMRKLELRFDRVLCSPWVRARQTAEIVCRGLKLSSKLQESEILIPGHSCREVAHLVTMAGRERRTILLVGHEPGLSSLAAMLLVDRGHLNIKLRKAGLCKIYLDESPKRHGAVLEWLLTPETMI
jgi:phosphohistidine phosphatase